MNKILIAVALLSLGGCSLFTPATGTAAGAGYTAGKAGPPPAPAASADSSQTTMDITAVQQKLIDGGFLQGPADGRWGPRTEAALRGYQQAHNLTVTGKLNPETNTSLAGNTPKNVAN